MNDDDEQEFVNRKELRDQFAMAALTGLIAGNQAGFSEWIVTAAYEYADAMLAERQKPNERVK